MLLAPFVPSAVAAYPDSFDSYVGYTSFNTGNFASSPGAFGPWTYTSGSTTCLPGTLYSQQFLSSASDPSSPNVWAWSINEGASCFNQAFSTSISAQVNATQQAITLTFYLAFTGAAPVTGSGQVDILIDGSTCGSSCQFLFNALPSTWTKETVTFSGFTPGTSHVLQVTAATSAIGAASGNFLVGLDSLFVNGANVVVSPYTLELIDAVTQQWFNITSFAGSSLSVQYASAFNCASYGMAQLGSDVCTLGGSTPNTQLNVPDINVGLSGATLVTVDVGGSVPYTRTLIPAPNFLTGTTPARQLLYLNKPVQGNFFGYVLTVDDFTTHFPTSTTEVFILQGNAVLTSGYLDPQGQFAFTLPPGQYTVTLENTPYSFTQALSLSSVSAAPKLIIETASQSIPIGPLQQFSYSVGWDCDTLGATASFTDSLGATTALWSTLYRSNSSGTFAIFTNKQTLSPTLGTPITATYDFRNSSISQFKIANASEWLVGFNATLGSGSTNYPGTTTRFGPFAIASGVAGCPSVGPPQAGASSSFNIPAAVLGLSQVMSAPNAFEEILAAGVVMLTAAMFGARLAHVGMLVIGGELWLFGVMTWLPLASIFVGTVMFIGTAGTLVNRARRPIT